METGVPRTLHKLNKDGWTDGCGVPWICFMALDVLAGETAVGMSGWAILVDLGVARAWEGAHGRGCVTFLT